MFANCAAIPDHQEFPEVRPRLDSYEFPRQLVDCSTLGARVAKVERDLNNNPKDRRLITYRVPWNSPDVIDHGSLNLVFSQAVLEHVDALEETYFAMSNWLKAGGYMSHVIDFGAHHLSPFWDGHRAYRDLEWRLVRGRREFLLNREPFSTHLNCAEKAGLEVVQILCNVDDNCLPEHCLAPRFQQLSLKDRHTRGAVLIL